MSSVHILVKIRQFPKHSFDSKKAIIEVKSLLNNSLQNINWLTNTMVMFSYNPLPNYIKNNRRTSHVLTLWLLFERICSRISINTFLMDTDNKYILLLYASDTEHWPGLAPKVTNKSNDPSCYMIKLPSLASLPTR